MARSSLPKPTETAVLTQSRRRCCICFGLDRDTRLKAGQIAHLDKSNSNHSESNLAFLCLMHHDEYDSTSSQRKSFTIGEVKKFREELYSNINRAFTQPVHFGEITTPAIDPYAGSWIRMGSGADSAEIKLTPLPDSFEGDVQYYVSGLALWGTEREYGPNLGLMEFVGVLSGSGVIKYTRDGAYNQVALTCLTFNEDSVLTVAESNCLGQYGLGVSFEGLYRRAI